MKRTLLFIVAALTVILTAAFILSRSSQNNAIQTSQTIFDSFEEPIPSVSAPDLDEGNAYSVYTISGMEEAAGGYRVIARSRVMYSGEKAVEAAMRETGCPRDRIFDGDCAPSLNNNFYFSKDESPAQTFFLAADVPVELYREGELSPVSVELLFNLVTQTDAFVSEAGRVSFVFELEGLNIKRIQEQYVP